MADAGGFSNVGGGSTGNFSGAATFLGPSGYGLYVGEPGAGEAKKLADSTTKFLKGLTKGVNYGSKAFLPQAGLVSSLLGKSGKTGMFDISEANAANVLRGDDRGMGINPGAGNIPSNQAFGGREAGEIKMEEDFIRNLSGRDAAEYAGIIKQGAGRGGEYSVDPRYDRAFIESHPEMFTEPTVTPAPAPAATSNTNNTSQNGGQSMALSEGENKQNLLLDELIASSKEGTGLHKPFTFSMLDQDVSFVPKANRSQADQLMGFGQAGFSNIMDVEDLAFRREALDKGLLADTSRANQLYDISKRTLDQNEPGTLDYISTGVSLYDSLFGKDGIWEWGGDDSGTDDVSYDWGY